MNKTKIVTQLSLQVRLSQLAAIGLISGLVGCGGSDGNSLMVQEGSNANNPDASEMQTGVNEQANGEQSSGEQSSGEQGSSEPVDQTDSPDPDVMDPAAGDNAEYEAMYKATFNATWSADTHATNFPGDPHFSPLHGAVHGPQTILWSRGDIATDGIELMAETGDTTLLDGESQFAVDEGRALSVIYGGGIAQSPGSVSVEFLVNRTHPQVTLVSMLAPSPDWFVGVNGVKLLGDDGAFIDTITIDLRLYDSGTDNGQEYTSADEDTQPGSPIALVNSFPFQTPFIDGEPTVGQLVIEKIQ